MSNGKTWLVGAGNMGTAILTRWLESGLSPDSFVVIDPVRETSIGSVPLYARPPEDNQPDMLFLSIKPQSLEGAAPLLRTAMSSQTILVSMLAGVETETLRAHFPDLRAIARIMPNLAVSIGKGVIPVYMREKDAQAVAAVLPLLTPLGFVETISNEADFHALTALVGGGPAFLFRYIDAMVKAAEGNGVSPNLAMTFVKSLLSDPQLFQDYAPDNRDDFDPEFGLALTALVGEAVAAAANRSLEMSRSSLTPPKEASA